MNRGPSNPKLHQIYLQIFKNLKGAENYKTKLDRNKIRTERCEWRPTGNFGIERDIKTKQQKNFNRWQKLTAYSQGREMMNWKVIVRNSHKIQIRK